MPGDRFARFRLSTSDAPLEPTGPADDGEVEDHVLTVLETPATYVVDTLADEDDRDYSPGDLSLREAIRMANDGPIANTITFDPALLAAGPAEIAEILKRKQKKDGD